MKNYFIVGDIHGCLFTFTKLLQNWNPMKETLICVGDFIDRGNFSAAVVKKCMEIQQTYLDTIFLKGNHEAEMADHHDRGFNENWWRQGGEATWNNFSVSEEDLCRSVHWFQQLPLKLETPTLMVTHAGITDTADPWNEQADDSVLWNRKPLKKLEKLQIHGHTPLKTTKALYTEASHSWNIDTGACYGYGLYALLVNGNGEIQKHIHVATDSRDIG